MTKPIEFEKFIPAALRLYEISVSIERANDHGLRQNALASHLVDARADALPKPPTRFS